MNSVRFRSCPVALAVFATAGTFASCLTEAHAQGFQSNAIVAYYGQAFTTGNAASYSSLVFTFFLDAGKTTPTGAGTGYLYTTPYTGVESSVGTGAFASTTASNNQYTFNSVVLSGSTTFYFYENALLSNLPTQTGGTYYMATSSSNPYSTNTNASTYYNAVTGGAASAPEPGTFTLLAAFPLAGGIALRRRRGR